MIRPIGNNIVAKIEVSQTTKTGIFLSNAAAEQIAPKKARVLAVGETVKSIKPNDEIVFKPYATFEIKLSKDDECILLDEADVLGVVEG